MSTIDHSRGGAADEIFVVDEVLTDVWFQQTYWRIQQAFRESAPS